MTIELKVLKAVLLLRKVNTYQSKEEQIAEQMEWIEKGWTTEESLDRWIESMKEDYAKSPEQLEKEHEEFLERLCEAEAQDFYNEYCPSATAGDYSPSNPWNAPGMSIRDFI